MDTATRKPAAPKKESGDVDLSESETGSEEDVTRKPIAEKTAAGKPYAPSISDCQRRPKAENIKWSQSTRVSSHNSSYGSSLLDRQGGIHGREHDDPMGDLDVNMAI